MDFKFSKKNRKQSVVVDGKQSSLIDVVSGVPQGTVFGHTGRMELRKHSLFNRVSMGTWLCREWAAFDSCFLFSTLAHTCCCCCLPTPMALASGGSPMFPLVVHQPASLASSAVTSAGSVQKSRGDHVVRMWVQLKR